MTRSYSERYTQSAASVSWPWADHDSEVLSRSLVLRRSTRQHIGGTSPCDPPTRTGKASTEAQT